VQENDSKMTQIRQKNKHSYSTLFSPCGLTSSVRVMWN